MSDQGLRELERRAALGDAEAGAAFARALQRTDGFVPCLDCGHFFPAWLEHSCDPVTGDSIYQGGAAGVVRRDLIYDSEYVDLRSAQTSFFVSFHSFTNVAPGQKFWGVDTNLQGTQGLPAGWTFQAHRIAALLPAGLDEERRDWLLNNTYLQIRSASRELQTIPGLLCFRDETAGAEEWVVQIAGGPPEDVPLDERRGNEGIKGVDLTVNGVGIVFKGLESFRVVLGKPVLWTEANPVLIRVVMAGFMVRDYQR